MACGLGSSLAKHISLHGSPLFGRLSTLDGRRHRLSWHWLDCYVGSGLDLAVKLGFSSALNSIPPLSPAQDEPLSNEIRELLNGRQATSRD